MTQSSNRIIRFYINESDNSNNNTNSNYSNENNIGNNSNKSIKDNNSLSSSRKTDTNKDEETKKLEEGKDGKLKSEMTDNKTMIYGKNNIKKAKDENAGKELITENKSEEIQYKMKCLEKKREDV